MVDERRVAGRLERNAADDSCTSKIGIPALPDWVVARPRLTTRLAKGTRRALTVVTGAPGAGKTVAVASWVAARSAAAPETLAWVTGDDVDNDPDVLWCYLQEALRRGDRRGALALVLEAERAAPRDVALKLQRAMVSRALGDLPGALLALDEALDIEPYDFVALLSKGAVIERMSGERAAATIYKNALTIAPPDEELPPGWNAIPGARGCTPEACGFRDAHGQFADAGALGAIVTGSGPTVAALARHIGHADALASAVPGSVVVSAPPALRCCHSGSSQRCLKNWIARSCRSAAARLANVPRFRRRPVRGSFLRE